MEPTSSGRSARAGRVPDIESDIDEFARAQFGPPERRYAQSRMAVKVSSSCALASGGSSGFMVAVDSAGPFIAGPRDSSWSGSSRNPPENPKNGVPGASEV
jgi:hypothetical protein